MIVNATAVVPGEYFNQPPLPDPVLDKVRLKKDLQLGVVVDGCTLERKKRIEIK